MYRYSNRVIILRMYNVETTENDFFERRYSASENR